MHYTHVPAFTADLSEWKTASSALPHIIGKFKREKYWCRSMGQDARMAMGISFGVYYHSVTESAQYGMAQVLVRVGGFGEIVVSPLDWSAPRYSWWSEIGWIKVLGLIYSPIPREAALADIVNAVNTEIEQKEKDTQ